MTSDDPYLVVAADKGTATFSDIANGIAEGRGFWLGDAFASGGSHGYDHKKMGITARGAWEAVKRHFRELGRDIQNEDFTVRRRGRHVGRCVRQRHAAVASISSWWRRSITATSSSIPIRDPAKSFAERQRMFDLPRSSWDDYNTNLLGQGGGIFARTAEGNSADAGSAGADRHQGRQAFARRR